MGEKYVVWANARTAGDVIWGDRRKSWLAEVDAMTGISDMFPNVYRVTIELIEPPQEQPQWWVWEVIGSRGKWVDVKESTAPEVYIWRSTSGTHRTRVYGTTADRDAKRDALMDAAKAAGKDS